MGVFKDLTSRSASRHAKEHHRIRWYEASYYSSNRGVLQQYVEECANDKWYVEVQSTHHNSSSPVKSIDTALIKYGPVHGNVPSDVARLFKNAGIEVLGKIMPQGEVQHVKEGCRHVNCCSHDDCSQWG